MVRNQSRITPSHPAGVSNDQQLSKHGLPDHGNASAPSTPKFSPAEQRSVHGSPDRSTLPSWVHDHAPDSSSKPLKSEPEKLTTSADFLTVVEVAAIWRVHPKTVYRRLGEGEVPHIRIGRQFRIPRKGLADG